MAYIKDEVYEDENNCLTTDLSSGVPTSTDYAEGSRMYVWDATTVPPSLSTIFKLHSASGSKAWYEL